MERTVNNPKEIDLGNGTLRLLFDFDILISMEEANFSVNELGEKTATVPFGTIRRLLWFGAQRAHPDLKLEAIGPMIDLREMNRISQDVNTILESQMPEKAANPPAPPPIIQ